MIAPLLWPCTYHRFLFFGNLYYKVIKCVHQPGDNRHDPEDNLHGPGKGMSKQAKISIVICDMTKLIMTQGLQQFCRELFRLHAWFTRKTAAGGDLAPGALLPTLEHLALPLISTLAPGTATYPRAPGTATYPTASGTASDINPCTWRTATYPRASGTATDINPCN